jgi:hypothetical protein
VKTAKELIREIGLAVQPPQGIAIVLTEQPGELPNWVAAAHGTEETAALRDCDPTYVRSGSSRPFGDVGSMSALPESGRRSA